MSSRLEAPQAQRTDGALPGHLPLSQRTNFTTLAILTAAYTVAFLDRQILAVLQEQVKRDLLLSDSQLGLLTGFSFALFYATFGVFIGSLADRWNRRNVVAISLVLWSIPTMLCGAASNFIGLLLARTGVAIGESGCVPSSFSLISDLYPPERRTSAIAFFTTGSNWGILLGFLAGGWLGELLGWRWTFVVAGIPGLLIAVLVMALAKEPIRRNLSKTPLKIRAGFENMWRAPALRWLVCANILATLAAYGTISWSASYLIRIHGMSAGAAGTWLALVLGLGGAVGVCIIGLTTDRLTLRDPRWGMWLCALLYLALTPFTLLFYLAPDATLALIVGSIPLACVSGCTSPSISLLHRMTPSNFRATASAIILLATNIFGLGAGVWLVGIVSDLLHPSFGQQSLRWALAICVPVSALLSSFCFWKVSRNPLHEAEVR